MVANDVGRRLLGGLTVLVLAAGCAGSAILTQTPISTPGPTAAATATPTPTPTPTATPTTTIPTGPMTVGRQLHTATLLADGRVLVVGGYPIGLTPSLASADLYDPKTHAFTATGPLAHARGSHTATLLSDGRVLIAGGNPGSWAFNGPYLTSAETYDPKTGTFSPTGSLATARTYHTATLLADGRVLIAGGNDSYAGGHAVASAELYDPKSGKFSPTGPLVVARGFHTATLLADGRVLIAGGGDAGWTVSHFLASAEIYDPKTGKFTATGPMAKERANHTATLLSDGRVLIAGGAYGGGTSSLASAELYDPKTGKFTATGSLATARTFHTATRLSDGRVLVTGGDQRGWVYKGPFEASAEIYDPKTGTFSPTGPMADARVSRTATLLSDGRVLIAGGYDGLGGTASAELYDPQSGTFSPAG
jgi:hypothetical protein